MVDEDGDDDELTEYELGFLRGVFAARNIQDPSREQMRDAVELMHLHSVQTDMEPN